MKMVMKSWKFRLMTPYQRNELGSRLLLAAHRHLSNPANPMAAFGYDLLPFNSTEATRLLWEIWSKDGNFYRKHGHLTKWFKIEAQIRSIPWRVRSRVGLIWGALTGNDRVGWME
jgi:hypothetical protein